MSNKEIKETNGSYNKKGLGSFFRGLKAEFKRITWPQKKDIKKATVAVVGFCVLYMALVGVLDAVFVNVYQMIFK